MTPDLTRFRLLAQRVVGWLAVLLSVFVGLEVAARAEDRITHGTPFDSPFRSQADLFVRTPEGMHGRPGAQFERWVMNGLGFRGPEADSVKTPGKLRVMAAGASEMFGLYESRDREVPRLLEDSLRRRLTSSPCAARGVEVWNAALPGLGLPSLEQDLRLRIAPFAPDVIVLYPTPAFYLGNSRPRALAVHASIVPREPSPLRPLYPRSWQRLRSQLKALVPAPAATWVREREVSRSNQRGGGDWRFTELPGERLDAFEEDLRRVVGTARRLGAELVLATHGNAFYPGAIVRGTPDLLVAWEKFHPRATPSVLVSFDSAARERTLRVAADSAIPLADVAGMIAAADRMGYADYAHFNDLGAGIAARAMAEATEVAVSRRAAQSGCRSQSWP